MKILIAEDDPVARHILTAVLEKWGHVVELALDGEEALRAMERPEAPQLVILDWMMPKMDGIDVCRELRKSTREPYVYIFLLTAKDEKEDIIRGLDAGADDYLTKPFNQAELQVRLRAAKRVLDLQAELIAARERLRVEATHDHLTRLWNRGAIIDVLRRELARAQRERSSVAVIMADLDHFKRVNDTYGHQGGDAVLREAAQRLRSSIRVYDAVGRYGGEEFLIVAPGCPGPCAGVIAERIRQRIGDKPMEIDGKPLVVTISAGVASTASAQPTELESLIAAADKALYRAKELGRNRVEVAA